MDEKQNLFLMIGLPKTGKTTYLAALWYVVRHADDVPGAIKLSKLQGEYSHLNSICEQWIQYQPMTRTNLSSETIVSMELEMEDNSIFVYFPDVSGEQFKDQVQKRICKKEYIESAKISTGALLFINAGDIDKPLQINQVTALSQTISGASNNINDALSPQTNEWSPSNVYTQTKCVELLQVLLDNDDISKPFRIAVIISAWDLITTGVSPEEFLERELPLFNQYLKANISIFSSNVFGISAQGADYNDQNERDTFSSQTTGNPTKRIIVEHAGNKSNDITEPLKWLVRNNKDEK